MIFHSLRLKIISKIKLSQASFGMKIIDISHLIMNAIPFGQKKKEKKKEKHLQAIAKVKNKEHHRRKTQL